MRQEHNINTGNKMTKIIEIKTADLSDLVLNGMQTVRGSKAFQAMMVNPVNHSKLNNAFNKFNNSNNTEEKAGYVADMLGLIK